MPAGQDLPPTRRANIRVKLQKKEQEEEKTTAVIWVSVFASVPLGLLLVSSASPAHHMHAVKTIQQEWTNRHVVMLVPCPHPHRGTMALPGLPRPQHGLVRPKLPCSWARPSHADPETQIRSLPAHGHRLADRCWSHISRHACSAQSCRSLFRFPPRNLQHPRPAGAGP